MSATPEQQAANLHAAIQQHVAIGFRVVSQTPASAQLLRPKTFSCAIATLSFLVFGVGFLVYIFWYASQKDQIVYLNVEPDGRVHSTMDTAPSESGGIADNTPLLLAGGAATLVLGGVCVVCVIMPLVLGSSGS